MPLAPLVPLVPFAPFVPLAPDGPFVFHESLVSPFLHFTLALTSLTVPAFFLAHT